MLLDPQEWAQIELLRGTPAEPLTAALLQRLLGPGDAFIDVGAHVGWLSLIAARAVGPSGAVLAIDPQPYNCDKILSNAAANGFTQIVAVACAVGEAPGLVRLASQPQSDRSRLTLAEPTGVNDTAQSFLAFVRTVPELMEAAGLARAKALKIDVEGFEPQVLRGAAPVLAQIENIVFEALPENPRAYDEAAALLTARGFELVTVEGRPLEPAAAPERNVWARRS
ncbi:MAG: FkbM family methyltransferase [Pseudomonadota bacterium]